MCEAEDGNCDAPKRRVSAAGSRGYVNGNLSSLIESVGRIPG